MIGKTDILEEVPNVRQESPSERRRWWISRELELTVWQSGDGASRGFQLCHEDGGEELALTWTAERGFSQNRVDDGEGPAGRPKRTPMLIHGGEPDARGLLEKFDRQSAWLPGEIADFVRKRLLEVGGDGDQ